MKVFSLIPALVAQVYANGEYPAGNSVVEFFVDVNEYIRWPQIFKSKSLHSPHSQGLLVAKEFDMTFQEIVEGNNYNFEDHITTTDDGYILHVYRIKHKLTKPGAPAVLLQHGIIDSADGWIMNHPTKSPAFVMADRGYDVWLGNQRGTMHSREHINLNPDSWTYSEREEFFNYSWEEMGYYDVPAMIKLVKKETDQPKISYIGHSMGSTQMFYALTTDRKEFLEESLNLVIALAPVVRLDHTRSKLLSFLVQYSDNIKQSLVFLGVYEFGYPFKQSTGFVCALVPSLCQYMEGFITTQNPDFDDPDRFQVYMGHQPAGTNLKSIDHFAQVYNKKQFQRYDYGTKEQNMEKYGKSSPPLIDLKQLAQQRVPIGLFVKELDNLSDLTDARWLKEQILQNGWGSDVLIHYEESSGGHCSFMVGTDMSYLKNVLKLLLRYNQFRQEDFHKLTHFDIGYVDDVHQFDGFKN